MFGHVFRHTSQANRACFGFGGCHHGGFADSKSSAQCLADRYRAVAFVLVWQQFLRHEQQPLDHAAQCRLGMVGLCHAVLAVAHPHALAWRQHGQHGGVVGDAVDIGRETD